MGVDAFLAGLDCLLTWLVAKAPLLTAIAAITGAVIAIMGYRKWLPENVGKRKIELAEEILADFYRARDIIKWARFNVQIVGVESERKSDGPETPEEKKARDGYYRIYEGLGREGEFISAIWPKKYRAVAYFGPAAQQPFEDLTRLYVMLTSTAADLMRHWPDAERPAAWAKWEAVAGESYDPDVGDEFSREVDALVSRVEGIFGEWLMRR